MRLLDIEREWVDALPRAKRDCLVRVQDLQGELLDSAEAGDWVHAAELERERADCLKALYADVEKLDPDAGQCLARITEKLIEGDRALMKRIEQERGRLGDELGHLRRGQKAVNAYTGHAGR